MARYFAEMRAAVERHGGTVEKFIGDAVMAVWGIPRLHEDDALRAVRAATDMRTAQQRLNDELEERYGVRLRVRTGVNTGEVVAGDPSRGQAFATRDAVNLAARLEQAASAGEILMGTGTHALVRDAVDAEPVEPLSLRGKSDPVPAFRLVAVRTGAPSPRGGEGAPLVGRLSELDALRAAFAAAVSSRHCERVTIVGVPGVGKSRLAEEFVAGIDRATHVVRGRCLSYGASTYWPVAEVMRAAAGIGPQDAPMEASARVRALLAGRPRGEMAAELLAALVGLAPTPITPEEGVWAVREHDAARPVLLAAIDHARRAGHTRAALEMEIYPQPVPLP